MKQSTSTLLMVKPHGFDYNAETAKDNHFQTGGTALSSSEITRHALNEFEAFVTQIRNHDIEIIVYDDQGKLVGTNRWNLATGVKATYIIYKN